jgi:hypothetical protein
MIKIRSTQAKSESELNEKASRMQNFKLKKSPRTTNKKPVLFTNKNIFLFPAKNPLPLGDGRY